MSAKWYGSKPQDPVQYLDDNGEPNPSIWVGLTVGDFVGTGVQIVVDDCPRELLLDVANTRKLIAYLTEAVEMFERVTQ